MVGAKEPQDNLAWFSYFRSGFLRGGELFSLWSALLDQINVGPQQQPPEHPRTLPEPSLKLSAHHPSKCCACHEIQSLCGEL